MATGTLTLDVSPDAGQRRKRLHVSPIPQHRRRVADGFDFVHAVREVKDRARPFSKKHRKYWLPVTGGMILLGFINVVVGMCTYDPPKRMSWLPRSQVTSWYSWIVFCGPPEGMSLPGDQGRYPGNVML